MVTRFSFESAKDFHKKFRLLDENNKIAVIPIIISSYGGETYPLLAMLDTIAMAKKPVATICMGAAMSCGAILLSAGTPGYRYQGPNSEVMIHEVSSGEYGKLTELESGIKAVKQLNNKILNILAKNAGQEKDFFIKEMKKRTNVDWYLNADETKRLGIIDHIGLPNFIK